MNQGLYPSLRSRPVTTAIILLFGVGFAITAVAPSLLPWFALSRSWPAESPLSVLFYAYTSDPSPRSFIYLLLAGWWMYWIGGEVESRLGPRRFALTWAIASIAMAIMIWAGIQLTGVNVIVLGPWIAIAAITMMWCARNPDTTLRFMFVLPIPGKWLAVITLVLIALGYREGAIFGLLFLAGCWFWAQGRIPFLPFEATKPLEPETVVRGGIKYDDVYYEDVAERERRRRENERLRKLFEGESSDES